MTNKTPTAKTIENWRRSIAKNGYKRIRLHILLAHFGAERRGSKVMDSIDRYLSGLTLNATPVPLCVDWGMAEDLDDSVRILPFSALGGGKADSSIELECDIPLARSETFGLSEKNASLQDGCDPSIIRAISIRQPYVEAILQGKKTVEYRSRKTNIRERVYLYAGMNPGESIYGLEAADYPKGVIVGTVEIVDCTGSEGDYEIHLANPKRLDKFLKPVNQPQPMFWRPQFERDK